MQTPEISIILPVRNIENEITGILRSLVLQTAGIEIEVIAVDMGSSDQTILRALQFIKEQKLSGFVIQNGSGSASAALNTGIQKSCGEYVTFAFARRLYRDYLQGYLDTARKASADLVFGSMEGDRPLPAGKSRRRPDGALYAAEIIKGRVHIDVSALLLRRKFLTDQQLYFQEDCRNGYAEEFVFRCLLGAGKIARCPVVLQRARDFELKRGKTGLIGKDIFQYADAMLRVQTIVETVYGRDKELQELFAQEKIPSSVMRGVDIMLREGNGYNSVRGYLKVAGYDRLLTTGRRTGRELKRRIACWRLIPWMYRPK
ncbi:MAG TPA: glycosyltransferase family 2 protein [Ruminococcaceae bacterium]|nr:glycosyltransferase family 2 protein [Oscillospiraceae bacterium]